MNYNSTYHPRSFIPKIIGGKLLSGFGNFPYGKNDLLVLNYHSTPRWLINEFENQIQYFEQHFRFVRPENLNEFYSQNISDDKSLSKPGLLFTFDDGLKNNLYAASLLEKYNTRGLFFVVPAFYNAPVNDQESYYRKHIRNLVNTNIDKDDEDVTAMSVYDLQQLINNGHNIGCHSWSHSMKASDSSGLQHKEIVESKLIIEEQFKTTVHHFCAPFDSITSTGKQHMQLIQKHYSFFHSTYPGSNQLEADPFFVKRVNVECFWPLDVVKFAISRFEWYRWKSKRDQFKAECF